MFELPRTQPIGTNTMKKANQKNTKAEVITSVATLKRATDFLDENSRKLTKKKEQIKSSEDNIDYCEREIEERKRTVIELEQGLVFLKKELDDMPKNPGVVMKTKRMIENIGNLPWVSRVHLRGDSIIIDTRENSLRTVFFKRLVYKNGNRAEELLEKPLVLPMPRYQICIRLDNMGGTWDRNNKLQIRLLEPSSLKFHPNLNELGLYQTSYAHWASHETPSNSDTSEAVWSDLCLNNYISVLRDSGSKGLSELLNEIVMFLQQAGWASAYRSKMDWATTLGYQPYCTELLRPLLDNETFESVQKDMRKRLPQFLSDNGLTQHMYDYGALAEGESVPEESHGLTYQELRQAVFNGTEIVQTVISPGIITWQQNESYTQGVAMDESEESDEENQ